MATLEKDPSTPVMLELASCLDMATTLRELDHLPRLLAMANEFLALEGPPVRLPIEVYDDLTMRDVLVNYPTKEDALKVVGQLQHPSAIFARLAAAEEFGHEHLRTACIEYIAKRFIKDQPRNAIAKNLGIPVDPATTALTQDHDLYHQGLDAAIGSRIM